MWNYTGSERPEFAIEPAVGQESVWDYPRPPVAEASGRLVEVVADDVQVARTWRSYRLKETASPPSFYLPPGDVDLDLLVPVQGSSICEWKGAAVYWALRSNPDTVVAWSYPNPRPPYDRLRKLPLVLPGPDRVLCR